MGVHRRHERGETAGQADPREALRRAREAMAQKSELERLEAQHAAGALSDEELAAAKQRLQSG